MNEVVLVGGLGRGEFDMEREGCESFNNNHDIRICVTMVGLVDVPDSNRSDFRRWRAVALPS